MNTLGPPILRQIYALTLHLHTRVHSFPKQHRFALGQHLTQQALGLLYNLTEANALRDAQARFEKLERSCGVVATLRVNLRLCYDLRCFSAKEHAMLSAQLEDVARQLQGWTTFTRRSLGSETQMP